MNDREEDRRADQVRHFLAGEAAAVKAATRAVERVLSHSGLGIPRDERSDIVQEVLMEACRAISQPGFRLRCDLAALLHTLALRRCIDWRRRRRPTGPLDEEVAGANPGPDSQMLENDRRRLATMIIGRLSGACRDLIRLHTYEGLSYQEISRRTGRSEGALRVEMCKCLKEARRLLDQNRREDPPPVRPPRGGRS